MADSMTVGPEITETDILIAHARALDECGRCFLMRHQHTQDRAFLYQAVKLTAKSVSLSQRLDGRDPNHIFHPEGLATLRCQLVCQTGDEGGLTESIEWIQKALLNLKVPGQKSTLQSTLCNCLGTRYCSNLRRYEADAQEVIRQGSEIRDPDKASSLAQVFMMMYRVNHELAVLNQAISYARMASTSVEEECDARHPPSSEMRAAEADIAATAAASALATGHSVDEALELLEAGRGILATYLLDSRVDQFQSNGTQLSKAEGALVSLLKRTMAQFELAISSDGKDAPGHRPHVGRAYELNMEIERILEMRQSSAEHGSLLLRPPQAAEMKAGICDGAIVITTASFSCDAIIVYKEEIRSLPLPLMTEADAERAFRVLEDMRKRPVHSSLLGETVLMWLWLVAVRPILDNLGFTGTPSPEESWPRVWWVPTGLLSQLPFHAAGFHAPGSSSLALDCNLRDTKVSERHRDPTVLIPLRLVQRRTPNLSRPPPGMVMAKGSLVLARQSTNH
ncbi:hypothetical protein B0T10DRAFT_553982 [Thelonectria olida]|uniref:Uncharacterized protein n=1 Tax=Thelonectria olida TaxID=1576542 RepID=A0A9P9AGE4_9HYPO|nr:hypothetical protein B0T10DRAFT_553982 [Thelonectria olida]